MQIAAPEELDGARFQVVHVEASQYWGSMTYRVDVILHDGYDADGLAPGTRSQRFFRQCKRVLDDGSAVNRLGAFVRRGGFTS